MTSLKVLRNKDTRKIKVFLGAYVNQTNAQNLSCRALAKYLNKEKFEVYSLELSRGNLPRLTEPGVKLFNCAFPVKAFGPIGFIWGFLNADVVYLPRGVFLGLQQLLVRFFRVKSFKTVRNVIDDESLRTAMSQIVKATDGEVAKGFDFVNKVYSMSNYMADYNFNRWGIVSQEINLLPPTDFSSFRNSWRIRKELKEFIFIGNDWKRKGLSDFLKLSNEYPNCKFHVVGKGAKNDFNDLIQHDNVIFHGLVVEERLVELVQKADLHVLPSKSEGLPRVWLETLSNGLPSILYKGYGAEEFLVSGVTGFVVDDLEELESVVLKLTTDEASMESLSKGAIECAQKFHPLKLTRQYEKVIMELHNE